MKSHVFALGVFLLTCSVSAEEETLDVQAFLPLLERNSLGRKILDVSYSLRYESNEQGKVDSGKQDIHLVFDAETEKYREEIKFYTNPNDADSDIFYVTMWDGKECVTWHRSVSKKPGFRSLGQGAYEYPGSASIHSRPLVNIPSYVRFYYDGSLRPFSKSVLEHDPKLGNLVGDTIIIETTSNKFEFSKKTGVLKKLDYRDSEMTVWKTYEFSNHVECSGIWIPLRIVNVWRESDGRETYKGIFSVDPKTLHLLDKVDDSIFYEALPTGCLVNDLIRKKIYTVTTADTLPNDVGALTKALEKMVEQALEQKEEAEKEMQEKGKKRE